MTPRSSVVARLACVLVIAVASLARAQSVANPADKVAGAERDTLTHTAEQSQRVWELPPFLVKGERISRLREEHRVGSYRQPRWTAHRRFAATRVYVVPEGFFEFEYWLIPEFERHGGTTEIKAQYEAEIGLPKRLQLDLYLVSHQHGNEGRLAFDEQKVELRWALANWNVIPANPAFYLEWIGIDSAPDHIEGKLLFGGGIGTGWHWGTNLVFEHEMGQAQENSNEFTAGLSYSIRDQRASLGAETKLAFVDVKGQRGDFTREYLIGPSLQFYPMPWAHLDLVPLFGVTDSSPAAQVTLVFGWEF